MQVLQFFVIPVYLLQTATNKKNTHKIKTKTDKANHRRKLLYLFDSGHDLGYPVKHADARKSQRNTIDDLKHRFVFTCGIFLAVVQFFRIHDVSSISHIYVKDSRIQGVKGSSVFGLNPDDLSNPFFYLPFTIFYLVYVLSAKI